MKSFTENPSFNKVDNKCLFDLKFPEYPNLKLFIIDLLKPMIFDDVLLINTFENGICITQNINNISNLSIFIDKKYITIHNFNFNIIIVSLHIVRGGITFQKHGIKSL